MSGPITRTGPVYSGPFPEPPRQSTSEAIGTHGSYEGWQLEAGGGGVVALVVGFGGIVVVTGGTVVATGGTVVAAATGAVVADSPTVSSAALAVDVVETTRTPRSGSGSEVNAAATVLTQTKPTSTGTPIESHRERRVAVAHAAMTSQGARAVTRNRVGRLQLLNAFHACSKVDPPD